jgi:hemerythrin
MPFVKWEERYLLGVEQFDDHHKHLVDLLNQVHGMFLSNEVAEGKLQEILDSLEEYANYHFDQEEGWMREVGFPKLEEHILEHKRFIYKLYDLNKQFNDNNACLTLEIVTFLRRWLLEHIMNVDAKYGVFIRK